jgi:hypothetical protein
MPGQVHFRIRIQHGVADGPNVLTGEHEMLYLIERCAAGAMSKYNSEWLKWYFENSLFSNYFLVAFFSISCAF